jgi:hypothetical protein
VNQEQPFDGVDIDYRLPGIIDSDSTSVTISLGSGLPPFISFNNPDKIRIKPTISGVTSSTGPMTVPVTVYLSDSVNPAVTFSLNVKIYTASANTAPYFNVALVNQTVNAGGIGTYTLPEAVDD